MAKKKAAKQKAPANKKAKKKLTPIGWTQQELADVVGCSRQHIGKLLKRGLLSKTANGKIDETKAVDEYMALSSEVGKDALREYNKTQKGKPKKKVVSKEKKKEEDREDISSRSMAIANAFNTAKLREKEFNAKIKELEYNRLKGELIPLNEVIEDATKTISLLKSHLTSLPARIAPKLLQRESIPEIQEIIFFEVNEMLKDFQETSFLKDDDGQLEQDGQGDPGKE